MNIANNSTNLLSDSSDNLEILFFDTFSSQSIDDRPVEDVSKKECSIGLIQFSKPVIINELRIIPLSTLVSAESLRGVRLGATIPSAFEVHFYVNDLKAKEAPTFLDIGSFAYKEHDRYIYKPEVQVPTDGLFLRGFFESLTIAVLGQVADITRLVGKKSENLSTISDEVQSDIHSNKHEIKELSHNEVLDCKPAAANSDECFHYGKKDANTKQERFDSTHLLSPSPETTTVCDRIRSPSPHQPPVATPKSISSNSSTVGEKSKELHYKSKYSKSPSHSVSPARLSVKSRPTISPPASYRLPLSSEERDNDQYRDSSSLRDRDRYGDAKHYQRHCSRRSKELSPGTSQRATSSSHYYRRRNKRSSSRDSLYGRSHYPYGFDKTGYSPSRSKSRDRRRSVTPDRNHDPRNLHSDTREDGQSSSRNRSGHYEFADPYRDCSSRSSSTSKQIISASRSRRSGSTSPTRKRKHSFSHSHNSNYSSSKQALIHSPEHKRPRYNLHSPSSTFTKRDYTIRSASKSLSPKVRSKVVENFTSPVSHHSIKSDHFSPLNMSPHSVISNASLNSLEQATFKTKEEETSGQSNILNGDPTTIVGPCFSKGQEELFEPLSASEEDLSEEDMEVLDCNRPESESNDNYEQISLSSDDQLDVDLESNYETGAAHISTTTSRSKTELLEVISSDEEELNDSNGQVNNESISDRISEENAEVRTEEEDAELSLNSDFFDPLVVDQLKPLRFPFNSNTVTSFIDAKLFSTICKSVDDKFGKNYSASNKCIHNEFINEDWVRDVEQLAFDIMKLTSPICCSFGIEPNRLVDNEQELKRLATMLIAITKDGLDFELAMSQKQAFKVRHLKAGIKLFIALFSSLELRSFDEKVKLSNLLLEANLPYDLLLLYNKPYMTLSLRLLILNGLIILCDFPEGVQYVCNKSFYWPESEKSIEDTESTSLASVPLEIVDAAAASQQTIYQYLLTIMLSQLQKSRLTPVFEELFDKIHLFELFNTLSQLNSAPNLSKLSDEHLAEDDCYESDEQPAGNKVYAMLVQLVSFFNRLSNRIHRPLRLLPNICQYEIKTAVHASTPLLLLSSASPSNVENNHELYDYIKRRFACRHISCSSSKIGFFSQKAFYKYLTHFDLLSLIINLLTSLTNHLKCASSVNSSTGAPQQQYSYICEVLVSLLHLITSHQQGLKYLLESERNTAFTNTIHKLLVDCESAVTGQPGCVADKLFHFGIEFITRLHSFNLVDDILDSLNNTHEAVLYETTAAENCISKLLRLYSMLHLKKSAFRQYVVSVLTMEHNFDAIASFIVPRNSRFNWQKTPSSDEALSLESMMFIYATKLAIACVQYLPEKHLIHFFDSYGQMLLTSVESVHKWTHSVSHKSTKSDLFYNQMNNFSSLHIWLAPLKTAGQFNSHDELTIRMFVTILKRYNDSCRDIFNSIENPINRVFYLGPELITAIKILVSLCDPSSDYAKNQDPDIQLKYKYSLVHCYSYDCMSYLLALLEAVAETSLRPSHRTIAYCLSDSCASFFLKPPDSINGPKQISSQQINGSFLIQGSIVLEFIQPTVRLLRLILNYLLTSVGSRFNDATPVPTLLLIYHLMDCHLLFAPGKPPLPSDPVTSVQRVAAAIQREIVDILLGVYTTVFIEHSESEETLKKSVWTKMLRHVLEFTTGSPRHFASGLAILSSILPRPLPLSMKRLLTELEVVNIMNFRKLWAAHIHVLSAQFEDMLQLLLLCDSSIVQDGLRRVCYQLCDLYTPTVRSLSKVVTEFFVHHLNNCFKSSVECVSAKAEPLDFLLHLPNHAHNCVQVLRFMLDMFSCNVAFRIGILHSLFVFGNTDGLVRKDSSKVHQLVGKLFDYLNKKKLDIDVHLDAANLLKNILCYEEYDSVSNIDKDIISLLGQYFEDGRTTMVAPTVDGEQYKFNEKLSAKFATTCAHSLNDYFNKRSICSHTLNEYKVDQSAGDLSRAHALNGRGGGEVEEKEDTRIYTAEFVQLFQKLNHRTTKWQPWAANKQVEQQSQSAEDTTTSGAKSQYQINLVKFNKQYFNADQNSIDKLFETFYSAIVEPPESPTEKVVEEPRERIAPINSKRTPLRGRTRLFNRNDPFRSRPPNTSRPPSLHVDEFEQRQDSLASLKNRSGPTFIYSGKHQEYIRNKKNLSSHHSHSHSHMNLYSNYTPGLKGSLPNSSNSLTNNLAHFK